MDALRNNVYTAIYKVIDGNLTTIIEPTAMDIDKLLDLLKEKNEEVIFTGDGLINHKDFIITNFNNPHFAPNHLSITRASSLGELGMKLLKSGKHDDPDSSPVYLKKPQAERELERRLSY